ncbi:MAG: hypothetical protein JRF58_04075 [Deltaproteobacteria bacterium]|nr:hypothetical protein [Deltaproteobacteria bacterium]
MDQNQEKISYGCISDIIPDRYRSIECTGVFGSEKAYLISRLFTEHPAPIVVIAPSEKEAETFLEDLRFFSEKLRPPMIYFPAYNILPFKYLSYHNETAAKRIRSLYRLIVGDVPQIVVTSVSAILQKIIPRKQLCDYAELVMAGEDIDRDALVKKLLSGGYLRSAIVEEPGDFCVFWTFFPRFIQTRSGSNCLGKP